MTTFEKSILLIGIVITLITSIYTQKTTRYVGVIDRIEDEETVVVLIENRLEEILFTNDAYEGNWTEGVKVKLKLKANEIVEITEVNERQ